MVLAGVLIFIDAGDGLSDIVRVRSGQVCYWPIQGYGCFGHRVTMDRSPPFDAPDQFDPRRIRFADIDGSGTSDLVYLGCHEVTLVLNQVGNAFSDAKPIRSLPPTHTIADVTVVDLLGQGTVCLVWSSPLPSKQSRPVAYVDLMDGKKPHLLEWIENNLGIDTQRQWSAKAIKRTTPLLLDLFSWITLVAHAFHSSGQPVSVRQSAWYAKPLPTFSDTLALVRQQLWTG